MSEYASPEFIEATSEGNGAVIIKNRSVSFFVQEDGVAMDPHGRGVARATHGAKQGEEGLVEGGRHMLEEFGGDTVRPRGFVFGECMEATEVDRRGEGV